MTTITVTLTDAAGASDSQSFTVTVEPPPVHRFAPSAPDNLMVKVEEILVRAPQPNPTGAASHYRIDATIEWDMPAYIGPDLDSDGNPDSEIMSYTIYRTPGDGGMAMKTIQVNKYISRNPDVMNPDFHNRRFVDKALAYNTTYTYTIMASSNLYGGGHASDGMDVTTQSQASPITSQFAPTEPLNVRAFALDNAITVRWSEPQYIGPLEHSPRITHYVIERTAYVMDPNSPIRLTGHKTVTVAGSVHEYRDQGLAYNTTYTYRVAAHSNLFGQGSWSAPYTLTTATSGGRLDPELAPPSKPRDVEADPMCADQITLSWKAPSYAGQAPAVFPGCATCTDVTPPHIGGEGAGIEVQPGKAVVVSYKIERRIGMGIWQVVATDVTDLTWTDDSEILKYGSKYSYRVSALNNANLYGDPEMDTLTLLEPDRPLRPSSLVVNLEQGETEFELQWDPPADDEDDPYWRTQKDFNDSRERGDFRSHNLSYLVQRQIDNGPWESVLMPNETLADPRDLHMVTPPGGMQQYALRHLYSREGLSTVLTQEHLDPAISRKDVNQDVRYRVSALVNACNPSPWNQADEVEIPPAGAPGAPTMLTTVTMGQSQISLSWMAPEDDGGSPISGYDVQYRMANQAWVPAVRLDAETTHLLENLMAGTTYEIRVAAINQINDVTGARAWTSTTGTTEAAPPLPDLGVPSITAASNAAGSATIALAPADNATKHFVWAFRVGGTDNATDGMWSNEAAGDATSVTMTGLTSGESYWFIAIAARGDGDQTEWSGWSGWTAPVSIQ